MKYQLRIVSAIRGTRVYKVGFGVGCRIVYNTALNLEHFTFCHITRLAGSPVLIGPDASEYYFLSYFWGFVFMPVKQSPLVILMLLTEIST